MNEVFQKIINLGRLSRLSYLCWSCLTIIIYIILKYIDSEMYDLVRLDIIFREGLTFATLVMIIGYAVCFYLKIIFAIQRVHDRNHSGWLSLLIVIPIIHYIFWLYLICAPGNLEANQYGQPRPTPRWEIVLAIIGVVLIITLTVFSPAILMK